MEVCVGISGVGLALLFFKDPALDIAACTKMSQPQQHPFFPLKAEIRKTYTITLMPSFFLIRIRVQLSIKSFYKFYLTNILFCIILVLVFLHYSINIYTGINLTTRLSIIFLKCQPILESFFSFKFSTKSQVTCQKMF